MEKSIFDGKKPPIFAMIVSDTIAGMKERIAPAISDGADVIGFQMEKLPLSERTCEKLKDLFAACGNLPIYITSYRGESNADLSEEERVEYMLKCLRCGATLGDVMGDLYHPEPTGMTFDATAAQRQKELVRKIHAMGKETLISTHTGTFLTSEELLRYARAQEERGTDIVKLVNYAETEAELVANMQTAGLFARELKKPYILLANGKECRPLRLSGVKKGVCAYLCRTVPEGEQPLVSTAKYWRDLDF